MLRIKYTVRQLPLQAVAVWLLWMPKDGLPQEVKLLQVRDAWQVGVCVALVGR
jgi:hypothetical protein